MSQVADAIVHSSGGTTRLIDRIEEAGLVERQVCRVDRRAVHVASPRRARRRLAGALEVHVEYVERDLVTRSSPTSERATSPRCSPS